MDQHLYFSVLILSDSPFNYELPEPEALLGVAGPEGAEYQGGDRHVCLLFTVSILWDSLFNYEVPEPEALLGVAGPEGAEHQVETAMCFYFLLFQSCETVSLIMKYLSLRLCLA